MSAERAWTVEVVTAVVGYRLRHLSDVPGAVEHFRIAYDREGQGRTRSVEGS